MSLLGVPHLVICVNKMDLVDHDPERFEAIRDEFTEFAAGLDLHDVTFIPISALDGDNVVDRSATMSWYEGPTLLHHLETVYTASDDNLIDVRFPVQYVIRPQRAEHRDYRGYAGTVAAGTLRPGDEVLVLPSGLTSRIERIDTADGPVEEARPAMAVTVLLADDLDISRGDMICRPHNQPTPSQDLDAMVAWMDSDCPLALRRVYTLKHTTRSVRAMVTDLRYRLDVHSLHRDTEATELSLNEIGRVTLRATAPLFADDYRRNRVTGSFVLIDEATNQTAAAGMLRTSREPPFCPLQTARSGRSPMTERVFWHPATVDRDVRWAASGLRGATVWFTGLSGSGKSTLADAVAVRLLAEGRAAYVLDGDNVRHGLNADLGFSAADRAENVRRVGEVARLMADAGLVALVPVISPYRADRDRVRAAHEAAGLRFVEVFVDTPLALCEQRDPEGPLRQGPRRRADRHDRHRRPLRGARRPRAARRAG